MAYLVLYYVNFIPEFENIISIIGIGCILIGLIVLNHHALFPGYWALLPCFGTFLLLSSPNSWINRNILSNKLLVRIGLISYPLYLWHWALLSLQFLSFYSEPNLTINTKISVLIFSFIGAWITYQFIEKPIRHTKINKGYVALLLVLIMFIIGACGCLVYLNNGITSRLGIERSAYIKYFEFDSKKYIEMKHDKNNYYSVHNIYSIIREECNFYDTQQLYRGHWTPIPRAQIDKKCYTKAPGTSKSVFIWGDSHAQALYPGLKNTLPKYISILQVTTSSCHPDLSVVTPNDLCTTSNDFALKVIKKEKPNIVIMAQYKEHDINKIRTIVATLKKLGVEEIIVVGPDPVWEPALYKVIGLKYWHNTPLNIATNLDQSIFDEENNLQKNINHNDFFNYISLIDFFCNKEGCLTYLNNNKKDGITTADYGHLTPVASTYFAKKALTPLILQLLEIKEKNQEQK